MWDHVPLCSVHHATESGRTHEERLRLWKTQVQGEGWRITADFGGDVLEH
jgi:hypothetical protein